MGIHKKALSVAQGDLSGRSAQWVPRGATSSRTQKEVAIMKTTKKSAGIVAAAVTGVLLVGGGALAFADTPGDTSSFIGTVKAPAENESEAADGSPEELAEEAAESDALAKLASVSEQEASRAATDLVPGTIRSIHLDEEDGYVVWEVEITRTDGTEVEVSVDAGDVSNTAQEVEDADEGTDADGSDDDRIVGTISAPAGAANDKEAEDGSPEEVAQDEAESAALAKVATVTEQEASKVATDASPGRLDTIQLEEEDGFVVWEADITRDDGTVVEVLIDAGDARILAQKTD